MFLDGYTFLLQFFREYRIMCAEVIFMTKKFYKIEHGKMISGVCGGVAEYFNMDPSAMRIIWVLLSFWGPGLIAYIIAAIILPNKSEVI